MTNLSADNQKLLPAFSENNVAVVFETSELFVPYLSVAIMSLIQTSSAENNYDILILSHETGDSDQERFLSLVRDRPNIRIRFANPAAMVEKYINRARYKYLDLNYYRMALPWILTQYSKVINLGADVLVMRDIADLYYERLDDSAYIGGVTDIGYQGRLALDISEKELGLSDPFAYVNADVLVLDLEKIRRDFDWDEFMAVWQARYFRCAEQDAMNFIFDGHIHHFDVRWNVFPEKMSSEFDMLRAPQGSIDMWKSSLENPYLIHYAALPKPWQVPSVGYGVHWWTYAKESPYWEEILRSMCAYLDEHAKICTESSAANKGMERLAPHGTVRRKIVSALIPKGSKRWCMLKKVLYSQQLKHMHKE